MIRSAKCEPASISLACVLLRGAADELAEARTMPGKTFLDAAWHSELSAPALTHLGRPPRLKQVLHAPVAQMDRALASGAKGRGFESLRARHFPLKNEAIAASVPSARIWFCLDSALGWRVGNHPANSLHPRDRATRAPHATQDQSKQVSDCCRKFYGSRS